MLFQNVTIDVVQQTQQSKAWIIAVLHITLRKKLKLVLYLFWFLYNP